VKQRAAFDIKKADTSLSIDCDMLVLSARITFINYAPLVQKIRIDKSIGCLCC